MRSAGKVGTVKIYLACRFDKQEEMLGAADVLRALGHEITSRWIDMDTAIVGPKGHAPDRMNADPSSCAPQAAYDVEDVLAADVVVVFTIYGPSSTGGRHVELGIALGAGKRVVLVGPRENIFQTLSDIEHYPSWASFVLSLTTPRRILESRSEAETKCPKCPHQRHDWYSRCPAYDPPLTLGNVKLGTRELSHCGCTYTYSDGAE